MPTTPVNTYTNTCLQPAQDPENAEVVAVKLQASKTYAQGCLLGEVGTTGVFGPYNAANSDGTEDAVLINKYACVTDANNNVTFGGSTAEFGQQHKNGVAYRTGIFRTADLYQTAGAGGGIDAGAVTDLGKLISGTISAGLLQVG